jgi:adenosylcobinamide-GDP ribazoletransferase
VKRVDEFAAALALLTRLPATRLIDGRPWPDAAATVWAYPLVGALIGAAGGAIFRLAAIAGMPAGLAAVLSIAALLLLTGGYHDDGLADTVDAYGGGATVAQKLEIMRDSRIGAYGTMALIVAFALRGVALASLAPAPGAAALIAACGLGRGAIIVVLLRLQPARADGIAATLRQTPAAVVIAGLILAAAAAGLLPLRMALLCVAGAVAAGLASAALARRQVGGYTGDILGATEVVAECVILCIVASVHT